MGSGRDLLEVTREREHPVRIQSGFYDVDSWLNIYKLNIEAGFFRAMVPVKEVRLLREG